MRPLIVLALLAAAGPSAAAGLKVVTDIPPIQSLVAQVMGDTGNPEMLLPPGGDPHEFQLRPSQAAALAAADIVFWDGPELSPALERILGAVPDPAKVVSLLHDGGGKTRDFEGEDALDPHAWLDPTNAEAWLGTIATRLSAVDPANAATYAANAAAARDRIAALDARLTAQIAPARGVPLVVFHDAMGYFSAHFGLTLAGAIELGDASQPSAARLAEIRGVIEGAGAKPCVFPEAGRDPKLVATVTEGTGARIGQGQDPVGLLLEPGPELYGKLLTALVASVADCAAR